MSCKPSVKDFYFVSFILFSNNSCDRCAIPDADVDEEKFGLKIEDGEDKKEEDYDDLEVLDEDVEGTNDKKEEERSKKTKE